jgi:hypothetical protein
MTSTSNGHHKYYDPDGKLIETANSNFHFTFNANGELTSIHFN